MKFTLCLTVAVALMLAAQIDRPAAQTSQPAAQATKGPLQLSEQDKAAVIKAAHEAKSHQQTPKAFTPAVGVSVPNTIYQHAFKPEITLAMPALKHYWYAYLDREIVLIDAMQKEVVVVIPLPANLVTHNKVDQGAVEPADTKNKDGASPAGSVPSHTSPETIR